MSLARDTWLVFGRYLWIFLRNPVWVIIRVIQPALYLVLFAPLLESISHVPGFPAGGAYNVFVPGLLIQLGLFGASGVGFGLIAELRSGVIERLRVTPISRFALLLGRTLRDILIMVVQALLLILMALPFGLSIHPLGIGLMLALLALLGLMMTPVSYALALWLGDENSFAPLIFTATLPLLLLSGVLLPMTFAPDWLRAIAAANPLAYAVDASRAIFNDHLSDPSIGLAVAIMGILAAIAVSFAARAFGRAVA
ncbi:MAG: ABC transporter permease [Chloroflexota bacterium]